MGSSAIASRPGRTESEDEQGADVDVGVSRSVCFDERAETVQRAEGKEEWIERIKGIFAKVLSISSGPLSEGNSGIVYVVGTICPTWPS